MNTEVFVISLAKTFGGGEIFMARLATLLKNKLHMTVISPSLMQLRDQLNNSGSKLVELTAGGGLILRFDALVCLWKLRLNLQQIKPYIVLNGRAASYLTPLVRMIVGHRPIVICHTEIVLQHGGFKQWLYGLAVQHAQCVIAVSDTVASQHRQCWPRTPVQAIPNWIESLAVDESKKFRLTTQPNGVLRLAIVARLSPGKGIEDVVAACIGLHGMELHLYGEGPMFDRFNIISKKIPTIHLHGYVKNIEQILSINDILVSGSYTESFSYTVAEGLNAGLLCVVSDIAAHRELLGPEYPDSLFFSPGDQNKLRQALECANSMIREDCGNAARTIVDKARLRLKIRNDPAVAEKNYLAVFMQS